MGRKLLVWHFGNVVLEETPKGYIPQIVTYWDEALREQMKAKSYNLGMKE